MFVAMVDHIQYLNREYLPTIGSRMNVGKGAFCLGSELGQIEKVHFTGSLQRNLELHIQGCYEASGVSWKSIKLWRRFVLPNHSQKRTVSNRVIGNHEWSIYNLKFCISGSEECPRSHNLRGERLSVSMGETCLLACSDACAAEVQLIYPQALIFNL